MAFDDLRSFLQALDDQGQLLKISEEVNAEPDLAAAANATGRIGDGAPALWFDNIRGFTDARVAMNTIGSWKTLICLIFCPCSVLTTATVVFISIKPAWFRAIPSTRIILASKTSAFTVWR